MKINFFFILLLGGLANIGFAQEYSLLWEISGKGLEQPSYLYGTIHIIPKDSFFILPAVEEKMAKADRLVMEISLDMNMGAMFSSMKSMMMPGGKTLKSVLSEEDYTFVSGFIKDSLSMPIPFFQMIKPIFTAQQIASDYCAVGEQQSYELYFNDIFKKNGKPISGLETVKEQMKYLDGISLEEQAKGLVESVRNPDAACAEFAKMVNIYRTQNLDALLELTQADEELDGHLDELLDSRNQKWINKITAMAEKESIFIAVGAGHLPGEQGVIALLKKEGYVVTPIK